jgi:hypothetical protein
VSHVHPARHEADVAVARPGLAGELQDGRLAFGDLGGIGLVHIRLDDHFAEIGERHEGGGRVHGLAFLDVQHEHRPGHRRPDRAVAQRDTRLVEDGRHPRDFLRGRLHSSGLGLERAARDIGAEREEAVVGLLRLILRDEGGVERGHGLPDHGGLGLGVDLGQYLARVDRVPFGHYKGREAAADRRAHVDRADGGDPAVDCENPRDGGGRGNLDGTTGGRVIQSCV